MNLNYKIIFLLSVIVLILSCNKDDTTNNNNNNNNNNTQKPYNLTCPKQSNDFCILNSKSLTYTVINSGISPLVTTASINKLTPNTGTFYFKSRSNKTVGSGYEFRYKYEIGNNCNEFILRQSPSEFKILRTIQFYANDSFAIMKDPILCPSNGCFLVNDKYLSNYLINKDKNECKKINNSPFINICECGLRNSGNKCKSEHKSFEIDNFYQVITSYIKGTDTYMFHTQGNKVNLIKLDANNLVWKKDISNYFPNFYHSLNNLSNNFSSLPNGNIIFGSIAKNTSNSSTIVLLEIQPSNGEIIKEKKYTVNGEGSYQPGAEIFKMNNNEYIMVCKINNKDFFVIFNSALQLIVAKEKPTLNDETLNYTPNYHYSDGSFVYIIFYKLGTENLNKYNMPIYKYNNRMELVSISNFDPEPLLKYGDETFYNKIIELSDKTYVLFMSSGNYSESGQQWIRINPDGTKLSTGILYSSRNSIESINAILDNKNIYFSWVDENSLMIAKADVNNGKAEYVSIFTPETSYSVDNIFGMYKENDYVSTITSGVHLRSNILKFKFHEESLYKYEICN